MTTSSTTPGGSFDFGLRRWFLQPSSKAQSSLALLGKGGIFIPTVLVLLSTLVEVGMYGEEDNFWDEEAKEDYYPLTLGVFPLAMPLDQILCESSPKAVQKGGVDEIVVLSLFSYGFWSFFSGFGGFVW